MLRVVFNLHIILRDEYYLFPKAVFSYLLREIVCHFNCSLKKTCKFSNYTLKLILEKCLQVFSFDIYLELLNLYFNCEVGNWVK